MVDQKKVEEAIKLLIEGIGEDLEREGLQDTPERIGRMYCELMAGMEQDPGEILSKTFSSDNNKMVIEKDITFHSMCEHHLMPFFGKVHIAYIPSGRVVGISKLARCVELFGRRLQIQERMTDQIADAIMEHLQPKGVMVMIEAEHMCMTMRGVKKPGSKTVTYSTRGDFDNQIDLQQKFMLLVKE